MLSLIEVQCPHCGARCQIMIPPVGAIIVGPCPQCHELVVLFCGHVLPLTREVMESGTMEERKDHLLSALTGFLNERVTELLKEHAEGPSEGRTGEGGEGPPPGLEFPGAQDARRKRSHSATISQVEVDRFAQVDLKLLDNKAYFNSVFGARE